jgi:hypothetical protein
LAFQKQRGPGEKPNTGLRVNSKKFIKNIKTSFPVYFFKGKMKRFLKRRLMRILRPLSLSQLQWSMNKDEIDGEAYVNAFKKIMLNGLIA